mgnify:CR=1 FL=1
MGCAYAKNKMESEYHIHIGKTAGEPAAHLPQRQQPDEPSCHQQQYINQILFQNFILRAIPEQKRSQPVELFLPNP